MKNVEKFYAGFDLKLGQRFKVDDPFYINTYVAIEKPCIRMINLILNHDIIPGYYPKLYECVYYLSPTGLIETYHPSANTDLNGPVISNTEVFSSFDDCFIYAFNDPNFKMVDIGRQTNIMRSETFKALSETSTDVSLDDYLIAIGDRINTKQEDMMSVFRCTDKSIEFTEFDFYPEEC